MAAIDVEFEDSFDEEDGCEDVIRDLEEHYNAGASAIMIDGHLQHVEHDTDHDCTIKVIVLDEIIDLSAAAGHLRFVAELMRRLGRQDKLLKLEPVELVPREPSIFLLLRLSVLQEEDADEEVEEEEGADQDEDHEEA